MTPSKEALWNIAVHRPKIRPAPTPVKRLGPFLKRQALPLVGVQADSARRGLRYQRPRRIPGARGIPDSQ